MPPIARRLVGGATGLLVVEVPCVLIVASNLLGYACQQQQRQQRNQLRLHSGLLFFFWGVGTLGCPNLNWIITLFFIACRQTHTDTRAEKRGGEFVDPTGDRWQFTRQAAQRKKSF